MVTTAHEGTITAQLYLQEEPTADQLSFIAAGMYAEFGAQHLATVSACQHLASDEDGYLKVQLCFAVPRLIPAMLLHADDIFPITHYTARLVAESEVVSVDWMDEVPVLTPWDGPGGSGAYWRKKKDSEHVIADASTLFGPFACGQAFIAEHEQMSWGQDPIGHQKVSTYVQSIGTNGQPMRPLQHISAYQVLRVHHSDGEAQHVVRLSQTYESQHLALAAARKMASRTSARDLDKDWFEYPMS